MRDNNGIQPAARDEQLYGANHFSKPPPRLMPIVMI